MKNRIVYTDEPMGELRVVSDFLPPPEELAFDEETIKVTISLSRSSVQFFKEQARLHHTPYQKMIRRLLDLYASRHKGGKVVAGRSRRLRRFVNTQDKESSCDPRR